MYVALTRAEEQLYVISNKLLTKKGDLVTNNLSYYFIEFLQNSGKYEDPKLNTNLEIQPEFQPTKHTKEKTIKLVL